MYHVPRRRFETSHRRNKVDLNKTIVYTYDNDGTLTSKKEYPYTTGTVGTATKTVAYGYDTAGKDKLYLSAASTIPMRIALSVKGIQEILLMR